MNDFGVGVAIGTVFGFGVGVCLLLNANSEFKPVREAYNVGKALIVQCESALPRNESCELVARKKEV